MEGRKPSPPVGRIGMGLATGATDDDIAAWIGAQAKKRPRVDIVL